MLINLEELKNKYSLEIKGVLHFGAHLAEESEIYNKLSIKNVIWFEANPDLARKVRAITNSNNVINTLISDEDNVECEFYITNNGQSSSMLRLGKHAEYYPDIVVTDKIKLITKRFDTLEKEYDIDMTKYNFLNLDIQGAELKALKGFGNLLQKVDYIYTEVNTEELYNGCALLEDLDEYLKYWGFERVEIKMTDKSWGDAFYIKKKRSTMIVMHVMPNEIDKFEKSIALLNKAAEYLDETDDVSLYVTLNLSKSLIDHDLYKDILSAIKKRFWDTYRSDKFANTTYFIHNESELLGTTSQKRRFINNHLWKIDQYIFLDSDICFHELTLKYMLNASKEINNKYYVITPQTIKLWDETWDVITHSKFISDEYGRHKDFNYRNALNQEINDINVIPINTFKFGCGWFTLYSASLLQFINIPEELGPYGSEDTYLMIGASIMKQLGYDVYQYVLDGIYIVEDYSKSSSYVEYKISKENQYIKHNTPQFAELVKKLVSRLEEAK